jgi:chromatin remodeling complex protein RSC6
VDNKDPNLPPGTSNIVEVCSLPSLLYPSILPSTDHTSRVLAIARLQWKKTPSDTPRDGFTIQRPGSTSVPARIILDIDHSPPRFQLAPELATLLQTKEDTRVGILGALWSYIKVHNLQDKEDRRRVVLDAKLKKVSSSLLPPPWYAGRSRRQSVD